MSNEDDTSRDKPLGDGLLYDFIHCRETALDRLLRWLLGGNLGRSTDARNVTGPFVALR